MGCCPGKCPCGCAPRASPVSDLAPFPSRDDQALEFLNVCLSNAQLPGLQTESVAAVHAARLRAALNHLWLAGYTLFLGVACPVLFFACLLPLEIESLPFELWSTSYFLVMRLVFLVCGSSWVWISMRTRPSNVTTAVVFVVTLALDVGTDFPTLCVGNVVRVSIRLVLQFACLLFPSVYVAGCCIFEHRRVRHALMHIVGMTSGAVPPFLAALFYYLLHHRGWKDSTSVFIIAVVLWGLTPMLLKTMAKPIWPRAAPAIPGIAPVLWIYYCEVAFSCFGFLVFMHTPSSIILYALSLSPLLLIQLLRGTEKAFRLVPCMGSLTLHRLVLYLDSFAAVMGRIAAYTLYMCCSVFQMYKPSQGLEVVRHSLVTGKQMTMVASINLYRQQEVTDGRLWMGVAGMVLVLCTYGVFSFVVPKMWKLQPSVRVGVEPAPRVEPAVVGAPDGDPAPVGTPTAPSAPRAPSETSSSGTQARHSQSSDRSVRSGWPPPTTLATPSTPSETSSSGTQAWHSQSSNHSVRSGWLQGRTHGTLVVAQQHELVLHFMGDYMGAMIVTLILVFALSILMINLVLYLLHPHKGFPCDGVATRHVN